MALNFHKLTESNVKMLAWSSTCVLAIVHIGMGLHCLPGVGKTVFTLHSLELAVMEKYGIMLIYANWLY